MRAFACVAAIVAACELLAGTAAARRIETLIADERPSKAVVVHDVATRRDGRVSGVLVNHSHKLLRDVRLLIHHNWFWRDEKHPGEDSPGRVAYYTVRTELPPDDEVEFTYRPDPPLPDRDDGHFDTTIEIVGWTEIGR